MDNNLRFQWYVVALKQYEEREGHCRVPALHVEVLEGMEIKLGSFVSYQRQRRRKILLACERARTGDSVAAMSKADGAHMRFRDREQALESVNGWAWGPLRPGPASKAARNREINKLYGEGTPVKALSDQFDLSRQRVHQIVGPSPKSVKQEVLV